MTFIWRHSFTMYTSLTTNESNLIASTQFPTWKKDGRADDGSSLSLHPKWLQVLLNWFWNNHYSPSDESIFGGIYDRSIVNSANKQDNARINYSHNKIIKFYLFHHSITFKSLPIVNYRLEWCPFLDNVYAKLWSICHLLNQTLLLSNWFNSY